MFNNLPDNAIELIYQYSGEKKEIQKYFQSNVLTKIDPSLYKLDYNCFACYYRKKLLNNELIDNLDVCIFGNHTIKHEKWFTCHSLPINNPKGDLLKLYNILNNNTKLFMLIYQNQLSRNRLLTDFYYYIQSK